MNQFFNNKVFTDLNESQKEAVKTLEGPLLVLSGEGTVVLFANGLTVDHISIKDDIAVLSIGSKGIALYDVSDIQNPKAKGIFDVGYAYKTEGPEHTQRILEKLSD